LLYLTNKIIHVIHSVRQQIQARLYVVLFNDKRTMSN